MAQNSSSPIDWGVGIIVSLVVVTALIGAGVYRLAKFLIAKVSDRAPKAQMPEPVVSDVKSKEAAPRAAKSTTTSPALKLQIPVITQPVKVPELTVEDIALRRGERVTKDEGADSYISLQFNESFSASVAIYRESGILKGCLRAISPPAAQAMRAAYNREKFLLKDQFFTNSSIEEAISAMEADGINMIRRLLKQPEETLVPTNTPTGTPEALSNEAVKAALDLIRKEMLGLTSVPPQHASVGVEEPRVAATDALTEVAELSEVKVQRNAVGVHRGEVKGFGHRKMYGSGTGSTFELTLALSSGKDFTLTGLRLRDLIKENDVKKGDIVEVQSLGKTELPNGRSRNEYALQVITRAAMA